MARERITEEVLKDGNIKVTIVFLATSKATSPESTSGKMINGYASGFMSTDSGAKINVVYGWNKNAPKENAKDKPEVPSISL